VCVRHPGRWRAAQPPTTRGGFRRPPRSRARRCRRPRPVSTIVRGGSVIANPPWCHHTSVVLDRGEVVMFSSPIDSAIQAQGVITPSIVRSSTSLGGVTRCRNRGAQRSVISLAVRDSSTPQEFVASKSSKLENNCREVNPVLSSRNGIPPRLHVTWRRARRSSARRRASGNHPGIELAADPLETESVHTTRNPSPVND
jgi:hypothetical protein